MSKKIIIAIFVVVALVLGFFAFSYLSFGKNPIVENLTKSEKSGYEIVEVVRGLEVPWSIVFTSPSRFLVAERSGTIRAVQDGNVSSPLKTFEEVSSTEEEGLMSLVLHPDYEENKHVYASYAYASSRGMAVKIVRMTDEGNSLSNVTVILDQIPAAKYHAGSKLSFGPDGKLYVATGDATDRNIAQDLASLGGKILRMNPDGSIPDDNPFGTYVWSYGHRNPQGLAWLSGALYSSEHGPSVFDGPAGGDEVNRIEKGGNYGWPLVSHEKTRTGTLSPLLVFTPAEAPGSLLAYSGKLFEEYEGNLFFGALKGEGIMRIRVNDDGSLTVAEKIASSYGRIREVAEAPDGSIYFTTSNRDGRGDVKEGDDKIYRIQRPTDDEI